MDEAVISTTGITLVRSLVECVCVELRRLVLNLEKLCWKVYGRLFVTYTRVEKNVWTRIFDCTNFCKLKGRFLFSSLP